MNAEEEPRPLGQKTREEAIRLLVEFVFSVGLIGGSSYLLFQVHKDQEEINTAVVQAVTEANEGTAGVEIAKVFALGQVKEADYYLDKLAERLRPLQAQDKLPADVWNKELERLKVESALQADTKGRIEGFDFKDPMFQASQKWMLALSEETLGYVHELDTMITRWERETVRDRDNHFAEIEKHRARLHEQWQALQAHVDQMDTGSSAFKREQQDQLDSFHSKSRVLKIKQALAALGVVAGCAFLVVCITVLCRAPIKPARQGQSS